MGLWVHSRMGIFCGERDIHVTGTSAFPIRNQKEKRSPISEIPYTLSESNQALT